MSKLSDKLKELNEARAEYHEKAAELTSAEIQEEGQKFKALQAEIQEIMTDGAKDCEAVGGATDENGEEIEALPHRPIGIFHDGTPNPFEIGDPITRDRRCRAVSIEDAVEKWNNDEWMPPREPGTAEATIRDVTGKVKEQKTVKARRA